MLCVWRVCSGYECSVQWQVWDREVWQRVLGWLSGNDLAVTKEHTQLWQVTWMVYNGLRGMERAAQWLCTMQTAHTGTLWSIWA